MKSTLILISFVSLLFAETPEKIPSLQKALKLNSRQVAEAAKNAKEAPFQIQNQNSSFDPSFLLDVDDDYSFKDPLTDPVAAKEREEHPEVSTQVSPEVLGIPQTGSLLNNMPATAAIPSNIPLVLRQSPNPVYGPAAPDQEQQAAAQVAMQVAQASSQSQAQSQAQNQVPAQNFGPMMAGVNYFGAASEKNPVPVSTPAQPVVGTSDVAVLLSNNQFFPSRIRLKEGSQTRLIFATLNKKPAALIIEKLQVQRWIAKGEDKQEITREISSSKVTEIVLSPVRGSYSFYDAMSGASGEIVVE